MLNLVEAAFQSVEAFYRRVYWQAPTATTLWADDFTLSYSGVAWLHSVNHLWLHHALKAEHIDRLIDSLDAAEQFFRPFAADYNVVFNEPDGGDVAQPLAKRGYVERLRSPVLLLDKRPRADKTNLHARI